MSNPPATDPNAVAPATGPAADPGPSVKDLDTIVSLAKRRGFVVLDPQRSPAHVFRVRRRLRREQDFDYFL